MGFFSWKTADTQEAIKNIYTGKNKTVYLLQPNKKPVKESFYDGYGNFGGIDAYDWLAENNIEKSILKKAEVLGIEKRMLGIYLEYEYYTDSRTEKKYSYVLSELFEDLNAFPSQTKGLAGNYGSLCEGEVINDLIDQGIWVKKSFEDYFGKVKYPLKFSFNKDADYNKLPASSNDENQGM